MIRVVMIVRRLVVIMIRVVVIMRRVVVVAVLSNGCRNHRGVNRAR